MSLNDRNKTKWQFTCSSLDCLSVIVRCIVFDPFPILVAFPYTPLVAIESSSNCAVSNKTRREGNLKCKPIF
jgi:hypothetical protein